MAAVTPPQSPSVHLGGDTPRARDWDSGAFLARFWLADSCVVVRDDLLLRLPGGQCTPVHGLRSQCVPRQTSAAASTEIQDSTSNRGVADTMLVTVRVSLCKKQSNSVSLIHRDPCGSFAPPPCHVTFSSGLVAETDLPPCQQGSKTLDRHISSHSLRDRTTLETSAPQCQHVAFQRLNQHQVSPTTTSTSPSLSEH